MTVSVKTEPDLSIGTPERLFLNTNLSLIFGRGYPWDIHPDGNQFLMMKPTSGVDGATASSPRNIIVVTNWFEKLKGRATVN